MVRNTVTQIDFLKYRLACLIFSLVLIGAFIGTALYRHYTGQDLFTYSVDFVGGTQVRFKFTEPTTSSEVVSILEKRGWAGPATREFSKTDMIVRVKDFSSDVHGLAENMREALQQQMPGNQVSILENEAVGSGVGAVLRSKSIRAITIALILMLLYIAWRFWSFAYAIGAVLALLHDALVILAVFMFFNREISMTFIGAILAVLGYSINDTIVIFSRIRENAAKMRSVPMYDIVNISINQTLSRTLLTSFSTALTVGAMFVLGGEALRDFSLALLVGIFFGTYSSIYMASPIMLFFYKDAR